MTCDDWSDAVERDDIVISDIEAGRCRYIVRVGGQDTDVFVAPV